MPIWLLPIIAIIISAWLLGYGADRLVDGATAIASKMGIPTLIIGVTIVALGTSAPEIVVSAVAAWNGNSGLAIGNAIGSNIANIGLVLGAAALFTPLLLQNGIVRHDVPMMLLVSLIVGFLLFDGVLSRSDGVILMVMMAAFTIHAVRRAKQGKLPLPQIDDLNATASTDNNAEPEPTDPNNSHRQAWWLLGSGLLILILSSRSLVWGAVSIAQYLGVSDLIIGLTIVAVGTSLPELAATIAAARRNDHDMAIGGIIGSHVYNLFAVLGIAALIGPTDVDPSVLSRDFPMMLSLVVLLWLIVWGDRRRGHPAIGRIAGALLGSCFIAYLVWVGLTAL